MTRSIRLRWLAPLMIAAMPALGAASGAAATPTRISISFSEKTADFMPLWIASDAGYFKQRGVDATVRYLPAQEGIPALVTSQTAIAGIGGSDALSAEAQGVKLKLIATLTPEYIFQFWAQKKYASASALKGQRVGITSTTGSLYAGTLLALKALGLTTSDVAITPLGSVSNVNSSLVAGSIAAAASHPPASYRFKQAGLVDLVDLAKKKIPSVSAGVWATQAYIEAHPDVVQGVVDAIVDAIRREKSDRAFVENEMRKRLGVKNHAELDFTYDYYVNSVLAPEPTPELAQLKSDQKSLSASNAKVKNVDVAAMVDPSFVDKAVKVGARSASAP